MIISRRLLAQGFAFVFVVLFLCVTVSSGFAAELNISIIAGTHGEVVKPAVTVDKVENLAGVKLAITYDQKTLKFIKAGKTSYTSNMLYVVNSKMPGKLIIVMAAAKGFSGENAELVKISFELLKDVKEEDKVTLQITEAELMGDDLQRIEIKFH